MEVLAAGVAAGEDGEGDGTSDACVGEGDDEAGDMVEEAVAVTVTVGVLTVVGLGVQPVIIETTATAPTSSAA